MLTPIIDWLLTRPEVDPERIGLVGRSFAGYLAPRAATVEHRFAALVADPAQPDVAAHLPSGVAGAVAAPLMSAVTKVSAERREFFGARMVAHGLSSVGDYFAELKRFSMLDHAGDITCPTLIVEAEHDFVGGGGATLAAAMTAPTTQVPLTAATGADGHCAGTARLQWARVVYDWLDDARLTLSPRGPFWQRDDIDPGDAGGPRRPDVLGGAVGPALRGLRRSAATTPSRASPSRSSPGSTRPRLPGVVRHADVDHVSRHPELFCSGQGAVSILDLPAEAHEFFGSLISMDAPRHTESGGWWPRRSPRAGSRPSSTTSSASRPPSSSTEAAALGGTARSTSSRRSRRRCRCWWCAT